MNLLRIRSLLILLTGAMIASVAFAQGRIQKRVNYTMNVHYELQMGDYMLAPGKYVLYQINPNDTNLFALYQNDMTDEPIAMIRTTRIEYQATEYPEKTRLLFDIDETSRDNHPVLRGWTIPGLDGWEIISVVAKDETVLTRIK